MVLSVGYFDQVTAHALRFRNGRENVSYIYNSVFNSPLRFPSYMVLVEDTDGKLESSKDSSCKKVESDAPLSTISDTEGDGESSEVSSQKQKQTSSTYNAEGRTSS